MDKNLKTYAELLEFLKGLTYQELDTPIALSEAELNYSPVKVRLSKMDTFPTESQYGEGEEYYQNLRIVLKINWY